MKRILFWVKTYDNHEDWFVVAENEHEAEIFFADNEGYDLDLVEADYVTAIECDIEDAAFFPPLDLLEKNGFQIISEDEPLVVWKDGKKYCQGNILKEIIIQVSKKKVGLYIISIKDTDLYKIGVTKDIENRLNQLQTGNPFEFHVHEFCITEKCWELETMLHKHLKDRRFKGEWFLINKGEISSVIKLARDFIGKPTLTEYRSPLHGIDLSKFIIPDSQKDDSELPF
jgi:hypothetical protein